MSYEYDPNNYRIRRTSVLQKSVTEYAYDNIDPETGLTYHWNRWRSEDGSVWLSEAPARDGTNWYGYCGNNPVMFMDRKGLEEEQTTTNRN